MADKLIALLEEQYLHCVICTEKYNETANVPRILGCNHTFCSVCLMKLDSGRGIKCPLCNNIHNLDNKDLESLHKDNIRRDLSSLLEKTRENGQSVQVTTPPSIQLCALAGHDLAPLEFFCEANQCRKAVCSKCVSNDHRDRKKHKVVNIDYGFMKRKESFNELILKFNKKISSITIIQKELKNNIDVLTQRQTKFNVALKDIFRKGHSALDKRKNKLLQKYDDACKIEKSRTFKEAEKLCSFIDNAMDYTRYLQVCIDSQPYFLDETKEMKKIQAILEFKFESKTQNRVFEDLENDLSSVQNFLHTFDVFKKIKTFEDFKRNTAESVRSGFNMMYQVSYMRAIFYAIMFIVLVVSLLSFYSSDPEFKFSRSDQFLCLVGNNNSTGVWSSEWFCGSHKKLIRYYGISGDNRSSIFTRSTRLDMDVTLSRKGFDCVQTNQTLFEVDLVSNNINLNYTYDQANTMWTLKTYTCTNKNSVCMKTKSTQILNTYLYLDSSQNILTGKFVIFLDYSFNNKTQIRVKSGNGTTIADETVSSGNLHPVFSTSKSNTISVTLSINSFEYINQEQSSNGHKTISNTPDWTQKTLNYTVPYIFASLQDTLIDKQTEIYAAIDIMFSIFNQTGQQNKLFKVSFGQVIDDTMFPVVYLEASICQQNVSHTITLPSHFCLNEIGNSAYSRTLDDGRIKLNFYFNFMSGEFHLSDDIKEEEIYVFKYDLYNRTHCVPYVVVEHVSVVNMTVTSMNKNRNYLYRFAVHLSDIVEWLLKNCVRLFEKFMSTFLSSVTAFLSLSYWVSLFIIGKVTAFTYFLYDVPWFIIEKITAFMGLLHGLSLMTIEMIKAFIVSLYDLPLFIMEKSIAFFYLLYDVFWLIIEKITSFMGLLHRLSLMTIEIIKVFILSLYDVPLFIAEKCIAFVYLLYDVLWSIIEKITRFMGLLHGLSLMTIEMIKAFILSLYDVLLSLAEKCIAFVYLLYYELLFIIEKITAFMGLLHGLSLMTIEKIKAFILSLYDVPLFIAEKCITFVYLLYDVLWFIIENITRFMGLLHGLSLMTIEKIKALILSLYDVLLSIAEKCIAFVYLLYDVLWFIIEKLTEFKGLLHVLSLMILEKIRAFILSLYDVPLLVMEKCIAYVYLLYDVLLFIIEKTTVLICMLHGLSLMIIEKIKAFILLLYDVPLFIVEKSIAFVSCLYDILWFITEKITAFMALMHGLSLMILEKIKAFIFLVYNVSLFLIETCIAFD